MRDNRLTWVVAVINNRDGPSGDLVSDDPRQALLLVIEMSLRAVRPYWVLG